jgi:hypothetical protein
MVIKKLRQMKTKIEKTIKGFKKAEIMQDEENFYIDLKTGLGESIYPKNQFSLEESINESITLKVE